MQIKDIYLLVSLFTFFHLKNFWNYYVKKIKYTQTWVARAEALYEKEQTWPVSD